MTARKPESSLKVLPSSAQIPFELGSLLGYRLLRLSTLIGNLAQRDSQEVAGLTLPEYRVLVVLHSKGPSGVSALQQHMMIDKAWISRTVASLVTKGLVNSHADKDDARRTVFVTTPQGQKLADALILKAHVRQSRLLRGLSGIELENLTDYLSRIHANAEEADLEGTDS